MTNINSISVLSIQQVLTSQLQAEQTTASQLASQMATGNQYTDLTDYAPSQAFNLMNLQASATQKQAYIGVIDTVQTRLSGYDTTMTDMESIVSQAQTLAAGNQSFNATTAQGIAAEASNYLKSVSVDLNQQIGGRYIYAGSRYNTAPVTDLTTLTQPASSTVYTDGASLPIYDSGYSASALTMAISGQNVAIGGTTGTPQVATVTVNGTVYSYTIQASDTTADIATGVAAALVAGGVTGSTASGSTVTVGGSNPPTAASANVTDTAAYATDSASIDSGYTVQYGVSSDNPAFQQMVAGLRYLQAAGNSTDSATYQADMTQATSLLTTALTSLQGVHAAVANNINTLTAETTIQKSAINNITNEVDDIQQVDMTQVSAELTALETQLQASYSATGSIEKMSIVQYL